VYVAPVPMRRGGRVVEGAPDMLLHVRYFQECVRLIFNHTGAARGLALYHQPRQSSINA
jgi:hypothetical protein